MDLYIRSFKKQGSIFDFLMAFIGTMLVEMRSSNGPKNIFILLIMTSGLLFVTFTSIANAALQLNVDPRYRGRIMDIYVFALVGTTPMGNYHASFLSEYFDVKIGFICCGLIILLLLVPFIWKNGMK